MTTAVRQPSPASANTQGDISLTCGAAEKKQGDADHQADDATAFSPSGLRPANPKSRLVVGQSIASQSTSPSTDYGTGQPRPMDSTPPQNPAANAVGGVVRTVADSAPGDRW